MNDEARRKLNAALGISEDEDFNDALDDLSKDENGNDLLDINSIFDDDDKLKVAPDKALAACSTQLQTSIKNVDNQLAIANSSLASGGDVINMNDVNNAFGDISTFVEVSKKIISHVYDVITSQDIIDGEALAAAATMISESRALISEYIGMYKERMKFYDKLRILDVQQQQKKELLEMKHKMDLEKLERLHPSIKVDDENGDTGSSNGSVGGMMKGGKMQWSQEEMIDIISNLPSGDGENS